MNAAMRGRRQGCRQAWTAIGLGLALLAPTAPAQTDADKTAELTARLQRKLAGKWIGNAAWLTDLDAAKAAAQRRNRQIFAYFTRSYAP